MIWDEAVIADNQDLRTSRSPAIDVSASDLLRAPTGSR